MLTYGQTKTGEISVQVSERFGAANREMLAYVNSLDDKIKKSVLRPSLRKAGTMLKQEIQRQIARRDMPYSRLKGSSKKKLKAKGTTPLRYTIAVRWWSKPSSGLFGVVVGPEWPKGAHGHLVEFGHKIKGQRNQRRYAGKRSKWIGSYRAIRRGGQRTIAHGFQQEAMNRIGDRLLDPMAARLADVLRKEAIRGNYR